MAKTSFPSQNVNVPEQQMQELELIAPEYLRGPRNAAKRVAWAMDEFLRSRREVVASEETAKANAS